MTYSDDTAAWPVLTQLVTCLRQEIANAGVPEPAFIGILPGAVWVADYAADCGGQAWVRLVTTYPSVAFPNPDAEPNNFDRLLAVQVEVGIARCAPSSDDDGTPPSVGEQAEAARLQLADMQVLYRTLRCCLDDDSVLGQYAPVGPEGGVLGGTWTAALPQADG